MKLISRKQLEDTTATASIEGLGFDITAELDTTMNNALKPIAGRLREYRAEQARLEANCARWTPTAYSEKMQELGAAAASGDEQAAQTLESGGPSKDSYTTAYAIAYRALENFKQTARGVFTEAAALIKEPMTLVVQRGQRILDKTLQDFGLPEYELRGQTNHIEWTCGQLELAGENLSCDLGGFWSRFK